MAPAPAEPESFLPPYPFPIVVPPAESVAPPATSLPEALLLASSPEGNTVQLHDTWLDDIRRALAQTEIGRRYEEAPADRSASNGDANHQPRPSRTDRLAG